MGKFTGHSITSDSALGSAVIERSLRCNDGDSPSLTRTPSGDGNRRIFTFSCWAKRSSLGLSAYHSMFAGREGSTTNVDYFLFWNSEELAFTNYNSTNYDVRTTQKFRDSSAWYHLVLSVDSTQGTAANRVKIYVNGSEVTSFADSTYPSQNYDFEINRAVTQYVGENSYNHMDGYMAEVNFIDGQQIDASYFGFTDPVTNIWMPKRYEGTYGTNGFYLDFSDNSSTAALGIDKSPNGNDFAVSGVAVSDSVIDTPTNNFCTLNTLDKGSITLTEGNLKATYAAAHETAMATFGMASGKWYWEVYNGTSNADGTLAGLGSNVGILNSHVGSTATSWGYENAGLVWNNSNGTGSNASLANGDIFGIAYDADQGIIRFYKNGTLQNDGFTGITANDYMPQVSLYHSGSFVVANFGQDSSFAGNKTAQGKTDASGLGDFYYTVPTGYKALCSRNLPPNVPSIVNSQKHFKCLTYTGDDSDDRDITGLEFKPDFVWIKNRGQLDWHILQDSVRGANKIWYANRSEGEVTDNTNGHVNYFNKDGFNLTAGASGNVNENNENYVAWCWKAGGDSNTYNIDGTGYGTVSAAGLDGGSTNPTGASINTKAGFSIITYTGTGSSATIAHGLGATPNIVITKSLSTSGSPIMLDTVGNSTAEYGLFLNDNGGYTSYQGGTYWSDTLPTSSVFTVNSNAATNASGVTYVAYCWRSIPGFSKFGTYKGNGNDDGTFIHTGFRPAWVTVKQTNASNNWETWDSARESSNVMQRILEFNDASTADDASEYTAVDFLSNGIKHRTSFTRSNDSGDTYLYMAFAEESGTTPFDTFPNAR